MEWLKRLLSFLKRPNDPMLTDLVAKYGLENRVNWEEMSGRGRGLEITFVRVVRSESERGWPLPPGFTDEAKKRLKRFHRRIWGRNISFPPQREMTQGEIDAEVASWNGYCALFNSTF